LTAAGISILGALLQINDTFSEDCLTLNIWTKPQVGERKKAVLVWIYDGGFSTGSSSIPLYDGQHIADEEDVIVVSMK
jgi:carboxylesterase type B